MSIRKKLCQNKIVARCLIRPVLKLHSLTYKLAGRLAITLNDGLHPKHDILKYEQWFLDQIQPDWIVLDIGCNIGLLPELLASKCRKVYGIEINEEYIIRARREHLRDNIEYVCADATTYNYSGCCPIDCVTLSNVLEHIEYRVDFLKKLINQVAWKDPQCRHFLIRVPSIEREWIAVYKKHMNIDFRLDPTHYIEYTIQGFYEELGQANIRIKTLEVRFGEIYACCVVDPHSANTERSTDAANGENQ